MSKEPPRRPRLEPRRLVVELHDVAPPFEAEIRAQLNALAAIGIERCVLNVVPDWHGRHPLTDSPTLVGLLQAQHRKGSELVLHGLEHRRRGPLRGPLHLQARAELFAGNAAEFLTLTPAEARESVRRGRELFGLAGLPLPDTFCAPGWLLAPELTAPLVDGGICRIIGMLGVHDGLAPRRPGTSTYRWVPAIGHMGASPLHEAGIQLGNRLLWLGLRSVWPAMEKGKPVRLYLHPQGGVSSPAARYTLATAARLVEQGWHPTIYKEVMPGGVRVGV